MPLSSSTWRPGYPHGKRKRTVYDVIDHVGEAWMDSMKAVACDMKPDFQEAFENRCPISNRSLTTSTSSRTSTKRLLVPSARTRRPLWARPSPVVENWLPVCCCPQIWLCPSVRGTYQGEPDFLYSGHHQGQVGKCLQTDERGNHGVWGPLWPMLLAGLRALATNSRSYSAGIRLSKTMIATSWSCSLLAGNPTSEILHPTAATIDSIKFAKSYHSHNNIFYSLLQ